jgi:hypothetical protein
MTTYTVRWVAATDATIATDYKVYSDKATSGVFVLDGTVNATDRGDGSYTPYATTLGAILNDISTSVTLSDAANFADGDYISVEGEMILLNGKSGSQFNTCTRGVGGSVVVSHANGVAIYKSHESGSVEVITWGTRKVVSVRVARLDSGVESVSTESVIVNPTPPPNNGYTTLYGILRSTQGNPLSGITVTMDIEASGPYFTSSGAVIYYQQATSTTDADGYFQFFVPRDSKTQNDKTISIKVGTGGAMIDWTVSTIPDVDYINFLET